MAGHPATGRSGDTGRPPARTTPTTYSTVFAHPGFEHSALTQDIWATRAEAQEHVEQEARQWELEGALVVPWQDGYLVSDKNDPMRVTHIVVRENHAS